MYYKETKGLLYLICIIIYGIYFLFKTYFLFSCLGLILIIFFIIIKTILDYKNYQQIIKENLIRAKKEEAILNKRNVYIDARGYERDKTDNRLIHRTVAYKYIYDSKKYSKKFSYYIIHHIDENKRNNKVNNLKILTKEEHVKIHGYKKKDIK